MAINESSSSKITNLLLLHEGKMLFQANNERTAAVL
jgi:hypothetical protein